MSQTFRVTISVCEWFERSTCTGWNFDGWCCPYGLCRSHCWAWIMYTFKYINILEFPFEVLWSRCTAKTLRFVTLMDRLTEYMLDPAASRDVSKPKVKLPIFLSCIIEFFMAFTDRPLQTITLLRAIVFSECVRTAQISWPRRKNFKMLWQKCLRQEKPYPAHVIVIQQYYMI